MILMCFMDNWNPAHYHFYTIYKIKNPEWYKPVGVEGFNDKRFSQELGLLLQMIPVKANIIFH